MSTPESEISFPVVITPAGAQPTPPQTILQTLLAAVAATNPGYTSNLPGSLVEDVSSTEVAGIVLCDQARVELLNSLTPYAANVFLLQQLGEIYGVYLGQPTNTSVNVVFTGTVGYVIANGVLVGDGTNIYQVQGGGVIGGGGTSPAITAIAVTAGSFAVPPNTVTTIATSIPSSVSLSVNNPLAGNPGGAAETYSAYRARVLQAGLSACTGTPRFVKTLVGQQLGAQANLVAVQQSAGVQKGLTVIVGGSADTYEIAFAIFQSISDVNMLVGSSINSNRNITVNLLDFPDTYSVLYVAAPQQTVTLSVTWNTNLPNFTGGSAFPGLVQQPLANYINALGIGQVVNILEMNDIFEDAVSNLLPGQYLTRLLFSVYINNVLTNPTAGTYMVSGDPEGYFFCQPNGISVVQG